MEWAGKKASGSRRAGLGSGQEGPELHTSLLLTTMGSHCRPLCLYKGSQWGQGRGLTWFLTQQGWAASTDPKLPRGGTSLDHHALSPPTLLALLSWPHPSPVQLHPLFKTRQFNGYLERQVCGNFLFK